MVTKNSSNKRALGLIFFIMLMDIIGLSILSPVAPYIVAQFSSDALMVTLLTVIYAAAQFLAAPILGKISDRVGRRRVLLVCVFGSAIGYFIFGIGGALWILFLSRLIDGITGGNLSTAAAYIADISKPEERARNFTLIGMAYGIGFILGPALGGALGQISLNAPLFAAGVISLISVVLVYFWLPESLPRERREKAPLRLKDFNPLVSIGYMMRKPGLGALLLVYLLFNFAFDGGNSTLGVFVVQKFTTQPWVIGSLFVTTGISLAIGQALLVKKVVPVFGEKRIALVSLIGTGIGYIFFVSMPALWLLYPVGFLQMGVTGFIWSCLGTLCANAVPDNEQGLLAGVNAALGGLASMLGPLWAGAVYDQISPASPYWMGAIVLVIASLILIQVKVKAPAASQTAPSSAAD